MTSPPFSSEQLSRDQACLDMARRSFLAIFESGRQVSLLSTATLLLTALTAASLVALKPWDAAGPPAQFSESATIGCLSISFLFGLLEQYVAIRVSIDVRIFHSLQTLSNRWHSRALNSGEAGSEHVAPEEILADAIQIIKSATPQALLNHTGGETRRSDCLDPYRKTARLYYKQVVFALLQMLSFWLYLVIPLLGR